MIQLAILLEGAERQSHGSIGTIFEIGTIQQKELKVLGRGLEGALDFEGGD